MQQGRTYRGIDELNKDARENRDQIHTDGLFSCVVARSTALFKFESSNSRFIRIVVLSCKGWVHDLAKGAEDVEFMLHVMIASAPDHHSLTQNLNIVDAHSANPFHGTCVTTHMATTRAFSFDITHRRISLTSNKIHVRRILLSFRKCFSETVSHKS